MVCTISLECSAATPLTRCDATSASAYLIDYGLNLYSAPSGYIGGLQGEIDRILSLQRRPPCASLCSPEELVQLQALCHEYLHAKRQYISLLRKIRAGAVYALFQANFMLRRLDRMSRHLLRARQHACDANTLDQDAIETNTDS